MREDLGEGGFGYSFLTLLLMLVHIDQFSGENAEDFKNILSDDKCYIALIYYIIRLFHRTNVICKRL